MSTWKYIAASLWHFRRIHLATAAGVLVAAAVISGALLVGDSMQGSLRDLVIRSLARIDTLVVAEQPFREVLLEQFESFDQNDAAAGVAPLLLTGGAATAGSGDETRRAAGLSIVGCEQRFWQLGHKATAAPAVAPATTGVAITVNVAADLGVSVGDAVVLRVPLVSAVPADSTLGERDDAVAIARMKVETILPDDRPLASFSLSPNQRMPRNVFIDLQELQELLELEDRLNAVALGSSDAGASLAEATRREWLESVEPTLADYGLTALELPEQPGVVQVEAARLVLPHHVVDVAGDVFGRQRVQEVVAYLANTMQRDGQSIPYSIVAAVQQKESLPGLLDVEGQPLQLAKHEIALNDWAADRLGAKVGDAVQLRYYEPETTHGQLDEQQLPAPLTVAAIVPLTSDGGPSTAADPRLTPELPGVTDQESINSWELPFELVEPIGDEDETYWEDHRTTPKAFVALALAEELWATRWGTTSLIRIAAQRDAPAEKVAATLADRLEPTQLGMQFVPAKHRALTAASGTTPFDGLFLGFSSFLMASAVMLVALLFRLGLDARAAEAGLLQAAGLPPKRLRRLWMVEGTVVAAIGSTAGILLGIGYARALIYGLNTWWVDATVTPFLSLHIDGTSLAIGWAAGVAAALGAMAFALRKFARTPARQLLAGDAGASLSANVGQGGRVWPIAAAAAAIVLAGVGTQSGGEAQAGAFFGSGAAALAATLLWLRNRLRQPHIAAPRRLGINGLAMRNIRRHPGRSILAIGLAASATFMIVAISAFRLEPTATGTGGFDLLATSDLPLYHDLNTPEGRDVYGFSTRQNIDWRGIRVVAVRVERGDDASCLNLFRSTQPRLLGIPVAQLSSSRFALAAAQTPTPDNPWELLDRDLGVDAQGRPVVPAILDRNTAFYSLGLYQIGDRYEGRDAFDRPIVYEVVGMLLNSVLQGDLLISEANLLRLFPETGGRRFFMIAAEEGADVRAIATTLESQLEDFGFDAIESERRLAELLAVQNTYLSTFQSLGLLGLLLGAAGLAAVQIRSVLERRAELALMQAQGFRRQRLAQMVFGENLALLLGGLGMGLLAAVVAVLPHAVGSRVGMPWWTLGALLGGVLAAGLIAGRAAIAAALRRPLLPSLRGD